MTNRIREATIVRSLGLGAAAAACVALFLLTRPRKPTSRLVRRLAPELRRTCRPACASRPCFSWRSRLACRRHAGTAGSRRAAFLAGPGRTALALSAPNARAYAAAFSRELAAGRRPVASHIRLDGLVNAFVGARPVAPGASPVLVETALTAPPWNPAHRLLRVTVRAQGPAGGLVARNAAASVDFAAAGVKSWRLLGHAGATPAPEAVALHSGDTVTTLYEIDPVAGASPGAAFATVSVRYAAVGGIERATPERPARRRRL